mmetsp:Transcript_40890/g.117460  ORF Transcript_40890/g.117460 Transcript_40890/m.117460 type:complete len:240 (+) Transcript_40890:1472-2191(+)
MRAPGEVAEVRIELRAQAVGCRAGARQAFDFYSGDLGGSLRANLRHLVREQLLGICHILVRTENVDNRRGAAGARLVDVDAGIGPRGNVLHDLALRALDPPHILRVDHQGNLRADRGAIHVARWLIRDLQQLGDNKAVCLPLGLLISLHVHCAVALLLRRLVDVDRCPAPALDLPDHGALPALQPTHAHRGDHHGVPLSELRSGAAAAEKRSRATVAARRTTRWAALVREAAAMVPLRQ